MAPGALFVCTRRSQILVYLSTDATTRRREMVLPTAWNSWTLVDTICSDSNAARKQISRNMKVLGATQCKNLPPAPVRTAPTAADLKISVFGEKKKATTKPTVLTLQSPVPAGVHVTATAPQLLQASPNEMEPDELKRIAAGCLEYLRVPKPKVGKFLSYLVVATLCYGLAPRQQVIRQLRLGSSFVRKEDGLYWVVMLSYQMKAGKAITFSLAKELTPALDIYIETIRPQLLGSKQHDFVFCKRNGDPPSDNFFYSDWTKGVTKELVGRPINAHAFRGGIVKAFYRTGVSQVLMNGLADAMGHDPATARNHYYREDAEKQTEEIHERMRDALATPLAASPAALPASPASSVAAETPGPAAAEPVHTPSGSMDESAVGAPIAIGGPTPDAVAAAAAIATASANS
jgi:integrase